MKIKVKNLTWGLLVIQLAAAGQAFAQSNPAVFTIKDCIVYAGENNSNVKVARLDEQIGKHQVNEVKGRALPQININGNFEDKVKVPLMVIPAGSPFAAAAGPAGANGLAFRAGYQYFSTLQAEATQMIIDPSFGIGLKAANRSKELYRQSTEQVSEQVALNISNSYYNVVVLNEQLSLLKTNLESTRKILAVTELQMANGVAKQVDVKRLRVNASNLESQITQAELNYNNAMNNLKYNMGMPLEQNLVLADTSLATGAETMLNEKAENAYENRIEYKLGKTNLELQKLNIKNQRSGYFPTLSAYANYGYVGQGPTFGFFKTPENRWVEYTTSSIGLRLRIPVFDGLQRNARIQQANIKYRQQEENLNLLKQGINLEVSNATAQYNNTLKRVEAEKANEELAQEVYQITQLEFREGVSTSTDLVQAETAWRVAQNTYTRTLFELFNARLNVEKAKGNLMNYLNTK
jgi:outer membrane protein